MDVFTAMETRRSCRNYLPDPIPEGDIQRILKAAAWAPSPLNSQPWHFTVITDDHTRLEIHEEADRCRNWAIEESGWKWLGGYKLDFLKQAPVLVGVTGDPKKTGMDMFQKEGNVGYQLACAAAIQNMMLAAHALGYGTLFFTMFDKPQMRSILGLDADTTPVAIVCIGKPQDEPGSVPRKEIDKKTTYVR